MQISWNSFARPAAWTACALAVIVTATLAVTQIAQSATPMIKNIPLGTATQRDASSAIAAPPGPCDGKFSNGRRISVPSPTYLQDVPGDQLFCDFHTFAWNQFIYLTQMALDPNDIGPDGKAKLTPLFLHMAPWYNLLMPAKTPAPTNYPGGSTALSATQIDQSQAGDSDHLVDVDNHTVQYDIRFNAYMYNAIAHGGLYYQAGYTAACVPNAKTNNCAHQLWLPPTTVAKQGDPPTPGSLEVKSSWRDFGTADKCPATQFYCDGRFGLVGLHLVQKTQTHGEWIWASFEHVANDPDCYPQGDTPIAAQSPLGTPWSFFSPTTAGPSVMASQMCEVTGTSPQCNADPKKPLFTTNKKQFVYVPVNVCRTDNLPAGGASPVNCGSVPDGPPQQSSNSGGNVACLNATLMPLRDGVWKNYKMIGSVWVRGTTAPEQDFRIQVYQPKDTKLPFGEAVGFPHLANTTMETWMQAGSTGYDFFGDNSYQSGCFNCHNMPTSAFEDDLSHYVGKLPVGKLMTVLQGRLSADSTKVVTEQPMDVIAPKPTKPAKTVKAPPKPH